MVKEYLDAGYDYGTVGVAAIKLRFKLLWKMCGRWLRLKFSSPKRLMCSESVIRLLQRGGYKSVGYLDPEITDAQVLLGAVQRASNEFETVT